MKNWKSSLRSYLMITLGAILYALAYDFFYAPNDIAFGGVTGIAQLVHRLVDFLPVGVLIILLNAPLFIIAWKFLGGHMLRGSLYAMLLSSLLIDLIPQWFTFPTLEEPLMACIFGGAVMGFSMGLICLEGASLGGTDIASRLVKMKVPTLSVGQAVLMLDCTVIVCVSLVFQQLNSALLGILALFLSTRVMDRVLFGVDPSKVAYIISDNAVEIAQAITVQMHRGVTILNGVGAFTGLDRKVLLCAFKSRQIVSLKRLVKEMDPKAFLIVCEAYEVLGDGFLKYDPKKP